MRTSVSVQRYAAEEYFTDEGNVPHHTKKERPGQEYRRTDIVISATARFETGPDLFAVVPLSHVAQENPEPRNAEPGVWGIEQIWLGASALHALDRRFHLLVGFGIPVAGTLGKLANAAQNHNKSSRIVIQPVLSNGSPPDRFGYYARLGVELHLDPGFDDVVGVYEFPLEFQLTAPIAGSVSVGIHSDARFTVVDYSSSRGSESHDVSAIGPLVACTLRDGLQVQALYRAEVLGYKSSAGHSWGFRFSKFLR